MTKADLKQDFIKSKQNGSKLMLVSILTKATQCGLRRAKFELVDIIMWESKSLEEFDRLWALLTKEEKLNLRKYKQDDTSN